MTLWLSCLPARRRSTTILRYFVTCSAACFLLPCLCATPAVAQCPGLCGDLNTNGFISSSDWQALRHFLYLDSALTVSDHCADLDGYDLINSRDMLYLADYMSFGGTAPVCITSHGRIIPSPSLNHRIDHTAFVPAHATNVAVLLRLVIVNSGVARAVNLAMKLSVDGVSPPIDSIDTDLDWSIGWANLSPVGGPPGSFKAGLFEPFGAQPGTSDMLKLYITVEPQPFPRPIALEHVDLPPIMDDQSGIPRPVQYTMILDNFYAAWIPDAPVCPIWNTGDANVDLLLTSSDVIYIVNYVFKGGFEPFPCPASADVDCSGAVTSADIINLVNHVFKGGPAPCNVCALIPGTWSCTLP